MRTREKAWLFTHGFAGATVFFGVLFYGYTRGPTPRQLQRSQEIVDLQLSCEQGMARIFAHIRPNEDDAGSEQRLLDMHHAAITGCRKAAQEQVDQ